MRDESDVWNEMKRLARQQKKAYDGFSDLFSEYFSAPIRAFKTKVFATLKKQGVNMVIPDTAVRRGKVTDYIDALKEADYQVIMTVVHASKRECGLAGRKREITEGKRYSAMSWTLAIYNVQGLFEYARESGYRKEAFFAIDNTDHKETISVCVPPYHDLYFSWRSEEGTSRGFGEVSLSGSVPFDMMKAIVPWADAEIRRTTYKGSKSGKWTRLRVTLRGVRGYACLIWQVAGTNHQSASGSFSEYDDFTRDVVGSLCLDLTRSNAYAVRRSENDEDERHDGVEMHGGDFVFTNDTQRESNRMLIIKDVAKRKGYLQICFYTTEDRENFFKGVMRCVAVANASL